MINTAASARTSAKASAIFSRRTVTKQEPGEVTVRPFVVRSFTADEHVVLNGFPNRPRFWARADTAISAEGEYFAINRPTPREVYVDCHTRFLPGSDLWDDTAGVWRPYFTKGVDYYWEADPAHKPSPQRIEYRMGKEILRFDCLTLEPGDYLVSSFNQGMDDAVEYTAVLVCSMENPMGYTLMRSEIDGVNAGETFQLFSGAKTREVPTLQHPAQITPCVVVLSVQRPNVALYVQGPDRKLYYGSLQSNEVNISSLRFRIGQDLFSVAKAYIRVLEWSLFPYAVKTEPVADRMNIYQLMSLYSSMYGAR